MKDFSQDTGEKELIRPKKLKLNEVRLNGQTGDFFLYKIVGKERGVKTEAQNLGNTIRIVMLNSNLEEMWQTNEFKKSGDEVFLFATGDRLPSNELYEKYPTLRTRQVIYSLLSLPGAEPELVRFIVKGSSATDGENTPEGCIKLFSYLEQKEEHSYEVITKISSVKEQGKLGSYFVSHFEKESLVPKELEPRVENEIESLIEYFKKLDTYYASPKAQITEEDKEEVATIKYDEGEVDPNDIPF
jgi:hypothetical protein